MSRGKKRFSKGMREGNFKTIFFKQGDRREFFVVEWPVVFHVLISEFLLLLTRATIFDTFAPSLSYP